MKSKSHIHNSKGYTLLMVLLSMGVFSISAIAVLTLTNQSSTAQKSFSSNLGKLNLNRDLALVMQDKKTCTSKIRQHPTAKSNNILSKNAQIDFELNGHIIGSDDTAARNLYDLSNIEIKLDNTTLVEPIPFTTNKLYKTNVSVSSDRSQMGPGGKKLKDFEIGTLFLELDNSKNIVSCFSDLSIEGSCRQMGGYYSATSDPTCSVPPACPSGQILVSEGAGKPGTCQNPPIRVEYVYVETPSTPTVVATNTTTNNTNQAAAPAQDACAVNPTICGYYKEVLGREPDLAGIQYWNAVSIGNKYDAPPMSLEQIKQAISNSGEAQSNR